MNGQMDELVCECMKQLERNLSAQRRPSHPKRRKTVRIMMATMTLMTMTLTLTLLMVVVVLLVVVDDGAHDNVDDEEDEEGR